MKTLAVAIGSLLALTCVRALPPGPERLKAECEMIIVPQKEAFELMADLEDDAKIEGAWMRLQQLVQTGVATQVAHMLGRSALEQRMRMETIELMRYASDFAAPEFLQKQIAGRAKPTKQDPHLEMKPGEVETRYIGETLELEVNWDRPEHDLLDVSVVAEHVRFLRWETYPGGRLPNAETFDYRQPVFHSMKSSLSFPLQPGHRILLGVHRVPDAEKPAFEFFFLRAFVERPGK